VPDFLLARRLDGVEAIGRGLALAVGGVGLRTVARHLDVPHTTARAWWRRFRARAPTLAAALVALAVGLDGAAVALTADGAAAALEALAVAWGRARARWGERVAGVWRFFSRVSGGRALGTTTTAPLAGPGGAAWMAPSR
jgi:transposase-like protein